ncbi:MAG: hypothetical protein Q4C74_05670 [Rothia sp. (in: high G+C Gram-positive bacteria)]|nr:hypothetical protein [Rothia sp. (in: high G+C Gram-positive bacteria)]
MSVDDAKLISVPVTFDSDNLEEQGVPVEIKALDSIRLILKCPICAKHINQKRIRETLIKILHLLLHPLRLSMDLDKSTGNPAPTFTA